ncbi:MAG: metal ABC transporter permease [Candidatus Jordarchaeum sp.]|uniref:metal ABC transporter permease n=1 Tax=Candidatus Jordarchaeum sp. TaxID=2823881 RepID=UPI00404B6943
MFELMFPPFIACLILTGIHAYLGIHVVEREVIFVDLSLAQIAALGAVFAVLFGFPLHSISAYFVSLLFTFIGATIFSLTRMKDKTVPQEAIIGIVYVVAAATAILVLDRIPQESEHIKHMLVGNILFVNWNDVLKIFILYSLIGIFHYIFRDRFILISVRLDEAQRRKIKIKLWDFLFYATFGVVVTSSVEIAGVLLVFSYLIIPAVCAMLLAKSLTKRLIIGWTLGTIGSVIGLFLSYKLDLPTGAAIVCTFGGILITLWIVKNSINMMTI